MTFKDDAAKALWELGLSNNTDPYGKACFRYASEWAIRMEEAFRDGKKIAEVAEQLSQDADDEGITGFMYGVAVSILSKCWVHGEALRLWHNLKTQIGTEGKEANDNGGVLNPALLVIQ